MESDTKFAIKFVTAFSAVWIVMPFLHELIHYLTALSFGYAPWFEFGRERFIVWYSYETPPELWIRFLVRHSPELVFLLVAGIITWTFRRNGFGLAFVLPFLVMAAYGFHGHLGGDLQF